MALLLALSVGGSIAQSKREQSKTDQVLALETKLNELLVQYTEYHPEVVSLRQQIQLLKRESSAAAVNQLNSQPGATNNTDLAATQKIPAQEKVASDSPAATRVDEPATKAGSAITPPRHEVQTSTAIHDTVPVPLTALPAAPSPASVAPSKIEPKKGPTFSPLPPDLAPANESQKNKSASAIRPDANKSMETLDDKHRLAIGDRLSFRIIEDEEESKSLVVADSGEIELPGSLGRFAAVDKSCKELARIIKVELEKEYYHQATVMIAVDLMARSRGKVYLAGHVRVPGPQEIPSDEELTLSKAILRAGGFNDFANKSKVKVTRKGGGSGRAEQEFIVDVGAIVEKGRTEFDLALQPGDLIYVDERTIRL